MFSLSAKGIYGVSAILELAFRYNDGAVQIRDIAEARKIPQHYLEQILVVLKRGGVVKSIRGVQGGYYLAGPPQSISLLEVMTLLEGPVEVVPNDRGDTRLQGLWHNLTEDIRTYLNKNLATLVEEVRKEESKLSYSI